MIERSIRSSIVVTIGRSRLFYGFITSAPRRLDAPSTVTLYAATLADVAVFASNDVAARDWTGADVRTTGVR